jgi:hypothetical protein
MSNAVKIFLSIAVGIGIIGFIATRPGGIWHLLGYQEMTTVHSYVIKSPVSDTYRTGSFPLDWLKS